MAGDCNQEIPVIFTSTGRPTVLRKTHDFRNEGSQSPLPPVSSKMYSNTVAVCWAIKCPPLRTEHVRAHAIWAGSCFTKNNHYSTFLDQTFLALWLIVLQIHSLIWEESVPKYSFPWVDENWNLFQSFPPCFCLSVF